MPDSSGSETLAVFIQLVSKTIEQTAVLKSSVDNVVKIQERQDGKLDTLATTLTRIETVNSGILQRVVTAEDRIGDHETRLRLVEPLKSVAEETVKDLVDLRGQQKETSVAIAEIEKKLIRYGAYATVILATVQFIVSVFIVPWIQNGWIK